VEVQSKFPIWSFIEESGERVSRTQHDNFFVGHLHPSEAFLIFVDGSDNLAHLRAGGAVDVHFISTLEVHTQAWRSLASGHWG
jgi:hypothetical protein